MNKTVDKKTIRLSFVAIILTIVLILNVVIAFTAARYIKRNKDEIIARYTSLYLDSTGANRVVTLDDNIGYIDFKLMNYIDEDVTQRDIVYNISKPSTFYDANGNILNPSDYGTCDLYVLDVWNKPQLVGKDSYKYDVSVVKNTGERLSETEDKYKFTYEKKDNVSVGKTHDITLKFERTDDSDLTIENVSVVVQLEKPYKEVHIFNITISNRLIGFATSQVKHFDIDYEILYIQSINSYSYVNKNNVYSKREYNFDNKTHWITNYPIKLTINWKGLMLDQNIVHRIHDGRVISDLTDPNGYSNDIFDIKDPFIYSLEADKDNGTMVIYIPQSTNFYLEFLKYSKNQEINVTIEILTETSDSSTTTKGFELYDDNYNGYTHTKTNPYVVYSSKEE